MFLAACKLNGSPMRNLQSRLFIFSGSFSNATKLSKIYEFGFNREHTD